MPNFKEIAFNRNVFQATKASQNDETWETPEKIPVKSASDTEGVSVKKRI